MDGGEVRRLDAREAALALERLEQRRLLAADVGAGAGVHDDVEREAGAEDVAPHRAVGVGLVQRRLQALEPQGELAAEVDEGLGDLQRVGRDQHALEDLVRVALDEHVVLEGGRLGLVAVDHEVGERGLGGSIDHLRPAGKPAPPRPSRLAASTSAATASGVMVSALRSAVVAAGGQVALQREGVVVAQARRDDLGGVGDGHQALSPRPRRPAPPWPRPWRPARPRWRACRPASPTVRRTRTSVPCAGTVSRQGARAQVRDQLVEALGRLRRRRSGG